MKQTSRRELLVGLTATVGTTLIGKLAHAENLLGARGYLDRVVSPSSSTILADVDANTRIISGSGLPLHYTGQLATPQANHFKLPRNPTIASRPVACGTTIFGVTLQNAVPIDPTGPNFFKNGVSTGLELDPSSVVLGPSFDLTVDNQGHLQPGGGYHYHKVPVALIRLLVAEKVRRGESVGMILIGFAADGFPIYYAGEHGGLAPLKPMDPSGPQGKMVTGYRLRPTPFSGRPIPYDFTNKQGEQIDTRGLFKGDYEFVGAGTLDDCNGRYGHTPEFGVTYHYFCTDQRPFFSGQWRGIPIAGSGLERPSPDSAPGHAIPDEVAQRFDMGFTGYSRG